MIRERLSRITAGVVVAAIAVLALAASASAHTGEWAAFNYCPSTNAEAFKCMKSVTNGGEIILGKKTVPIVNPVTLQGGLTKATKATNRFSKLIAATNGETLSKTAQPVPGGLLGIVPPASSPPLVKALSAFFFENGLTGVNATLELAKPANEVEVSEQHLIFEEEVALKLPVKVHLENPFLGKSCYVGSSSSPLIWNLTTGTTSPPAPNSPITGSSGAVEFIEEAQIAKITEAKLVDNAWSAPTASGCGGILSFLVNPIINSQIGLASAAGKNASILGKNSISLALTEAVNKH